MPPYVCLTWDRLDGRVAIFADSITAQLETQALRWEIRFERPGVRLYLPVAHRNSRHVLPLRSGAGIVVGALFPSSTELDRSSCYSTHSLTPHEEACILRSEGRSLVRTHWGSYVLFLSVPSGADLHVLRGPMSAIPCFWTDVNGVTVFMSRPADIFDLDGVPPRVNWDLIRAQSVMGDYLCEETGLSGVRSLVSGDCVTVRRGTRSHRTYWAPALLVDRPPSRGFEAAAESLHHITRTVIDCWVSEHPSVIVALSGGLDSSIVLSSVATAFSRTSVHAINFHSRLSGDERLYARSMAALCAVPLLEIPLTNEVDFTCFLSCTKTASPVLSFGGFATEPIFCRLAEELNASAVFTGELGDAVFGHAFGPELLAEALWRYGLTPQTLGVIHRYAMLHKVSIWRAARLALAEHRLYQQPNCQGTRQHLRTRTAPDDRCLATSESIEAYERMQPGFIHPWLQNATTRPPGWRQTLLGMIMLTSTWSHPAFSGENTSLLLSPLASQPIIEECLAIPADFHIAGAGSAAVARRAFGSLLSPEVLGRGKAKGNPEPWLSEVITRNRPFLRELLLEGILVRERILDKRKTDLALSGEITRSSARVADIIVQLYIEAWLRRWLGGAR
jgi:asparagine synthase (glutamine-hydrolysing)